MVISQTKRQIVAKEHLSWKKTSKSSRCGDPQELHTKDTKDTIVVVHPKPSNLFVHHAQVLGVSIDFQLRFAH